LCYASESKNKKFENLEKKLNDVKEKKNNRKKLQNIFKKSLFDMLLLENFLLGLDCIHKYHSFIILIYFWKEQKCGNKFEKNKNKYKKLLKSY
jgi:hypothetical protein